MTRTYKDTRIACYTGYFVQAIINNLSPVFFIIYQNKLGISYSLLSLLIIINFLTQLVTDVLSIGFAEKYGERKCVVVSHILSFVGMTLLGVLPSAMPNKFSGLLIATVVSAVGSGMIEVLISPIVSNLPSDDDAGDMSLLHSFYCWGQVVVILVTTVLLALNVKWWIIPLIWAVIPLINTFNFLSVPIIEQKDIHERLSFRKIFTSRIFIAFLLLMACSGAAEMSMSQWASLFMEKSLKITKALGDIIGPCMFALFMGIGRTVSGFSGNRLNLTKALMVAAFGCAVAYVIAALTNIPLLSLGAFALCGLCVSIMWPGVYSVCVDRFKTGSTAMFAFLALFGDLGCASGPAVTGFLTDFAEKSLSLTLDSLRFGLVCSSVFPFVMFLILFMLNKKQKN